MRNTKDLSGDRRDFIEELNINLLFSQVTVLKNLVPDLAVRDEAVEPTPGGRCAFVVGMSPQKSAQSFGGIFVLADGGLRLRDEQFNRRFGPVRLRDGELRLFECVVELLLVIEGLGERIVGIPAI